MSHTPAPWNIWSDCLTREGGHITIYANENDWIVSVNGRHVGVESDEETRANARRIVALINECENISTEDIEGGVISSWAKTVTEHQETLLELQTLKAVNELLKFENERMRAELAQKDLDRSKEHSEWILGKWNEDVKAFDTRRKTDAEKAKMLLGKWEYVEQTAPDPNLKYATWESLDQSMNFQAYDRDGWLFAYEKRPVICLKSEQWLPDGEHEVGQRIDQVDGPIPNWQQTLIERPADQDGPTGPDPSDLAHDHNEITYGADDPTEYDPS